MLLLLTLMNMFNVLFFCPPEYQWHIGIQNFGCNPIRLIWDNLTKISIFPWIQWCTIKTNICIGSHRWQQQWQYSDPPWLVLPGYPQLRFDNGTDLTKTKKIFYTCSRGSAMVLCSGCFAAKTAQNPPKCCINNRNGSFVNCHKGMHFKMNILIASTHKWFFLNMEEFSIIETTLDLLIGGELIHFSVCLTCV